MSRELLDNIGSWHKIPHQELHPMIHKMIRVDLDGCIDWLEQHSGVETKILCKSRQNIKHLQVYDNGWRSNPCSMRVKFVRHIFNFILLCLNLNQKKRLYPSSVICKYYPITTLQIFTDLRPLLGVYFIVNPICICNGWVGVKSKMDCIETGRNLCMAFRVRLSNYQILKPFLLACKKGSLTYLPKDVVRLIAKEILASGAA